MTSILLHIHDDSGMESRLQAACDIARSAPAHIHCVQVTAMPNLMTGEVYGGMSMAPTLMAELHEIDARMRTRMEQRLQREDVSWDWRQVDGDLVNGLLSASGLCDFMVVTLPAGPRREMSDPPHIAADLAMGGRTPVLAVPQDARGMMITGRAMVAWDGSQEASTALRLSVPLLKQAEEVHVVTVEEAGKFPFPATGAPEYLARHGIKTEFHSWPQDGRTVEATLKAAIGAIKPDWMVMGAFGHSRLRELVFGGVTRSMLRDVHIPLLLAH
ncbi:Universal stress protein UspA [Sphingobium herbicidovorans NBRC 16415]|jgi:nucleotide-binding universal stress UspA family protein|uniref:Universal stress protein UspA n=1 Tax=Sphingobium herbicidovorans (strain ATCC 700291 / DSM 11019 / CCUG 56400 / KCTC 2939 / LMG 18315 / NBRC 16415 / MH) TaxID=1219045 RepID=A0A086PC65_SPHHM|nr:universal stress protein [Sphingobium herbicidovorans]KFG90983.1 Universal stress protein UspA [Sphingobium herbicidovorans NBRC 16415]